jgi:hypothetical protein
MKKQKRFSAIISIKITYTVVYKQGSDKDILFKYRTRIFIPRNTFAKKKNTTSRKTG